jgi:hypothetical protein
MKPALVNLYEDADHKKTVADLETFAGVAPTAPITSQQIMDWYHFLGLKFDTQAGRFSPDKAKNLSKTGRLYYTLMKAKTAPDNIQNFGAIGMGYIENSMSYSPYLSYLNEDFAPSAFWSQRKNELLGQMNERMKTYDYDNIFTLDEQGKKLSEYEEEVTLYNIRAKESTEIANVNPPENSPSSPATPVNAINASYHPLSYFNIAETQGAEPWCSEYVAAAEINTLNQVNGSTPQDSRVTAQNLMQAYYPGTSLDQLKTMSGGTIENALKALQSKYQVTADVENRALSFDEVKKELDAGQTIQIDVNDTEETASQGSSDNAGHSLAIVGYVLPADGDTTKHAPYYEVWNPWWEKTFYVSSKAPYFNLAGTQYKWTRTWHNWRKVTTGATTKTAPAIAQQKVASTANPEAIKVNTLPRLSPKVPLYNLTTPNPTDYLFQASPFPQNNVLKGLVSEMRAPLYSAQDTHGNVFGYCYDSRFDYIIGLKNGHPRSSKYDDNAKTFKKSIDDMNEYNAQIIGAGFMTGATIAAVIAVQFVPGLNAAVDIILTVSGGGITYAEAINMINCIVQYNKAQNNANSAYNNL